MRADFDAREMNQTPRKTVFDPVTRTRRVPNLPTARPAERGAFFFAELCMFAFAIVVIQTLFGDYLRDVALAPLRHLANAHSDNTANKYATSLRGAGLQVRCSSASVHTPEYGTVYTPGALLLCF